MKYSYKKALAVLLVMAALLSLAACGGGGPSEDALTGHLDPKSPVTVTLWHYYVGENQRSLEEAVGSFNSTLGIENGVIVEAVAMGSLSELEANITDSAKGVINSAAMPQIFSCYPDKALEIDGYGLVADISGYFSEEERAAYVESFLEDGIFDDGRLLLMPIVKSTELMYVNKTAWDEFAGEQGFRSEDLATWEGVYETARAYYAWLDDRTPDTPWDGKPLMGFDSVANYIIIGSRQLGVDIIDAAAGEGGGAVLNDAALRRVFDIYYKGMSLGYFGAQGKFRSDDIKAGHMLAYVGSSSSAAYFPTWIEKDGSQSPIDFLALPYPAFEGGEHYAIQQGAGMCVTKSTPAQQEGAVLFLKWFTEAEQSTGFAMTTGYLPVNVEAYGSEAFEAAVARLLEGGKEENNVAAVYQVALSQIIDGGTYAAKPFPGSYDLRTTLQATLEEIGEEGIRTAAALKAEGAEEAEILEAIDAAGAYEAWKSRVKAALEEYGIYCEET